MGIKPVESDISSRSESVVSEKTPRFEQVSGDRYTPGLTGKRTRQLINPELSHLDVPRTEYKKLVSLKTALTPQQLRAQVTAEPPQPKTDSDYRKLAVPLAYLTTTATRDIPGSDKFIQRMRGFANAVEAKESKTPSEENFLNVYKTYEMRQALDSQGLVEKTGEVGKYRLTSAGGTFDADHINEILSNIQELHATKVLGA